jgi:hypothetical protein
VPGAHWIEIQTSSFRDDVIAYWESQDHHHQKLAAVANGTLAPPPQPS